MWLCLRHSLPGNRQDVWRAIEMISKVETDNSTLPSDFILLVINTLFENKSVRHRLVTTDV